MQTVKLLTVKMKTISILGMVYKICKKVVVENNVIGLGVFGHSMFKREISWPGNYV